MGLLLTFFVRCGHLRSPPSARIPVEENGTRQNCCVLSRLPVDAVDSLGPSRPEHIRRAPFGALGCRQRHQSHPEDPNCTKKVRCSFGTCEHCPPPPPKGMACRAVLGLQGPLGVNSHTAPKGTGSGLSTNLPPASRGATVNMTSRSRGVPDSKRVEPPNPLRNWHGLQRKCCRAPLVGRAGHRPPDSPWGVGALMGGDAEFA